MSYENSFNTEFGRKLTKTKSLEESQSLLDNEIEKFKARQLELSEASKKMAKGYEVVLEGLKDAFPNLDLNDANLVDSPGRMARALIEVCSGLGSDSKSVFRTMFPAEEYNQVILLRDIDFTSLCSHHFIPFTGVAHVGYLPDISSKDSKVVGLSKLARVVDLYSQRPQLQERLSYNIMKAIETELKPAGVMVVVKGQHGCLNCRGARKSQAEMVTSSLSGLFQSDSKLRKEFLSLIS